ncbi:MAG: GNAT family N-acetyltransferase, partial [Chthonomonadales bacterium]
IRPIEPTDSFDELTDLLHRAYAPLGEAGMEFVASHQDVEVTKKRAGWGSCHVAVLDGKLVGTVTIYGPMPDSRVELYRRDDTFHFGQFCVDPDLQNNGLGDRLLRHAEDFARKNGGSFLAFDTSERADRLISWYSKRGYASVGTTDWEATNYLSILFSKSLI